jgi:mannitol/fructose-specific phosphotransferase system IIA component (Ntr-type)
MTKNVFIRQVQSFIEYNNFVDKFLDLLGICSNVFDEAIGSWGEAIINAVNPHLQEGSVEENYFFETFYNLVAEGDIEPFNNFYDQLVIGQADPEYVKKYGKNYSGELT